MTTTPKPRFGATRVAIVERKGPDELAGGWCECPRTGQEVRVERCMSCQQAVAFHRADPEGPHIVCSVDRREAAVESRAAATAVESIMSQTPVCVEAHTSLEKLVPLLVDLNVGGVPVVDVQGRPLGMVSKTDLLAEEAERVDADAVAAEFSPVGALLATDSGNGHLRHTAADLMSSPLVSIMVRDSILHAAQVMTARSVHRLGVVDDAGRLVGVVSTTDVVRWLATRTR
jgi:CBS domain-containing protein